MRDEYRRGTSRQAQPRQTFYPMWGETPYRETNVRELYRYGEPGLLTRFIVPPSDVIDKRRHRSGRKLLGDTAYKLLMPGFAVEDVVVALLVVAFLVLLSQPVGAGIDGYIEAMGW